MTTDLMDTAASADAWLAPVAGLLQSMRDAPASILLLIIAVLTMAVALVAILQTRRWPGAVTVPKETAPATRPVAEAATAAAPRPAPQRPATTTDRITITFPAIDERHPDVWDPETGLDVVVVIDRDHWPEGAALHVTLAAQRDEGRTPLGGAAPDAKGRAVFSLEAQPIGEMDLVAELFVDSARQGQAVRAIRIVDYRAEVVETFEDFVAWAASQFGFVDSKRTAREFTDLFADGRPGTPTEPLDEIVDIYEIANFSEHPIDRATYLRLVDAFLELEDAGALEGPAEAR